MTKDIADRPPDAPENPTPPILAARAQVLAARKRREELAAAGQLGGEPSDLSVPSGSIPNYRLDRELHRGGQGVVYLATQESTGRRVAVKVIHCHVAGGRAEMARFEREVEALSRLKHRNVVTIHDCGRANDSVFLVMDYVAGVGLDTFVARERPTLRDMLSLFARVCDGVNAAHLRGVTHRDLKPSNIRVDEEGEPRILDFGLAKFAADTSAAAIHDGMTVTGQFVGSLPWASPEQAEGRSDAIDVRSDVYSLGVLLYHLLTGKFPYPVGERMSDSVRHITTTPPTRPTVAEKGIGSDVETILLKCLSKEPERRYQSAGELARDLRHFLAGEPIEAKRDSITYVLRKQARRYWLPSAVAVCFLILLAAGLVTSVTLLRRTEAALIEKEQQRRIADEARAETDQQRRLADERANQTQKVADFQSKMLSEIDVEAMGRGIKDQYREQVKSALERQFVGQFPDRRKRTSEEIETELAAFDRVTASALGGDVARKVMDEYVLKRAADAMEEEFGDQPLVHAQMQASIGGAYRSLGVLEAAEAQWRATLEKRQKQLGRDHEQIATAMNELAMVLQDQGDLAGAELLYRDSLAMRRRMFGDEHEDVAQSMSNLGNLLRDRGKFPEAEPLVRDALAMSRKLLGNDHTKVASMLNNMAAMLHSNGKLGDAEPAYLEAIEIQRNRHGGEHIEVVEVMSNLGVLYNDRGDYARAEPLNRQVLTLRQKIHGYEHPQVARALNTLAYTHHQLGNFVEAEPLYREAMRMRRSLLGDIHPDVGRALNNLGVVLKDMGNYDEAEPIQREALDVRIKALGENHPDIPRTINNLATLLKAKGDLDGAETLYRQALEGRRKTIGKEEHPDIARGLANLATVLSAKGNHTEAEELSRQALAIRRTVYGEEHPEIATNLNNLASELAEQGKHEEAGPIRLEALAMYRKLLGERHQLVASTLHNIAAADRKQGKFEEAEAMLREALAIYRERYTGDHPDISSTAEQLASLLIDMKKLEEAQPLITEAVAMSSRKFPGDHRYKASALSTLALYQFRSGDLDAARKTIMEASDMMLRMYPGGHKDSKSILDRRKLIVGE